MNPTVLLVAALLAGGPRTPSGPDARRLVLDERAGVRLELSRTARAETTPPMEGTLERVEVNGARTRLADRVGAAALLPGGAVLAVRRGELLRLEGASARILARGLAPELAVDPSGSRAALVRPDSAGGSAIELLDLADGAAAPVAVVSGPGLNNAPAFSADGASLLFVSTRTGLSSVFRVGLDGKGERQLTNRGLKTAASPGFVPPPERAQPRRFEAGRFTWTADGARWFAEPATGAAGKLADGGAR